MKLAAEIWRRYVTDGVPASGFNNPNRDDIRAWGTTFETMLSAGVAGLVFATLAEATADLVHNANTSAIVYNDAAPANNGLYCKIGVSGTGSWQRIGDLPIAVVPMTVTGGTANAIVATAPETPQSPGRKLFLLTPTANNSGATTLAYNGQSALPIKSAFGNALVGGELLNASPIMMLGASDHFTLLLSTNVDASGILAAAVAAQSAAASSASAAASNAALLGNQVAQYDTRAAAIAATIPGGVNFIRTLAYDSTFQENSGALFKRVAAGTAFIDTYPLTVTITGGSGYTNGTYRGIQMNATSGRNLTATVTVSGNAVTALDFTGCPGNAYKVGETITAPAGQIGGTGSGFSAAIATISSPVASFVNANDSSRWQYTPSKGFVHVNEFGAVADWTGADAGTTENFTAFWNALIFAGRQMSGLSADIGPAGDVMKCGVGAYRIKLPSAGKSLIVPFGVILEGVSGSILKIDDTSDNATHFITLGDPNTHLACFRSRLKNLSLLETAAGGAAGTAMVFSNNTQDFGGLEDVYIYAKQRGGVLFTNGYGGASTVRLWNVSVNWNSNTNPGISLNYGTTMVSMHDVIAGGPSSGSVAAIGISLAGTSGMYKIEGFHAENITTGIAVNLTSGGMCKVVNANGGSGVTSLVSLAATNQPGNFSIEEAAINGATTLVSNGQSGGTSRSTDVMPKDGIVFFNP
jgi:hypothetical protein